MKTIITLGPATESKEMILRLSEYADRFRLNSAHVDGEKLQDWLERIAEVGDQLGKHVPVVIDLQCAKTRIGSITPLDHLAGTIRLTHGDKTTRAGEIPVPSAEFLAALAKGDVLKLNDARVTVEVIARDDNGVACRVLENGPLTSFKGINRAVHPVPFRGLSRKDRDAIEIGHLFPTVEFACSFIFDGKEAGIVRELTKDRRLAAKIERPEAMPYLPQIDAAFDELWLCRGDMGAQAGLARLGAIQEQFIASDIISPRYLAGQVLEHMTESPQPTRSEVVHLHDIQRAGFDGVVLSDETAIGKHPLAVARILREMNHSWPLS